jgi:hypothetical protein
VLRTASFSGLGLRRRSRWFWLFALAVVVDFVLTWTDPVGWLDVLTGMIDLVLLVLLIVVRKEYWAQ